MNQTPRKGRLPSLNPSPGLAPNIAMQRSNGPKRTAMMTMHLDQMRNLSPQEYAAYQARYRQQMMLRQQMMMRQYQMAGPSQIGISGAGGTFGLGTFSCSAGVDNLFESCKQTEHR